MEDLKQETNQNIGEVRVDSDGAGNDLSKRVVLPEPEEENHIILYAIIVFIIIVLIVGGFSFREGISNLFNSTKPDTNPWSYEFQNGDFSGRINDIEGNTIEATGNFINTNDTIDNLPKDEVSVEILVNSETEFIRVVDIEGERIEEKGSFSDLATNLDKVDGFFAIPGGLSEPYEFFPLHRILYFISL